MKVKYPEFGDWLREARKQTGKTQRGLADDAPVSYGAIGQYETGRALPRYEYVTGVAEAYEVEIAEMMEKLIAATLSGEDPGLLKPLATLLFPARRMPAGTRPTPTLVTA